MKGSYAIGLSILRLVCLVVLFLMLSYDYSESSSKCPDHYCEIPVSARLKSVLQPAEVIIFLAIIAISIILKSYDRVTTQVTVLLIIIFLLFVTFLSILNVSCPTPIVCYFDSNVTCASNKLSTKTSELYLRLVNGLDHEIRIDGVKCIRSSTWNASTQNIIELLNQSIRMEHGSVATVVGSGDNSTIYNKVLCTTENGLIPTDTSIGTHACLNVYINYTDMKTGKVDILYGKLLARYEA